MYGVTLACMIRMGKLKRLIRFGNLILKGLIVVDWKGFFSCIFKNKHPLSISTKKASPTRISITTLDTHNFATLNIYLLVK
jgi:hypothetical protein